VLAFGPGGAVRPGQWVSRRGLDGGQAGGARDRGRAGHPVRSQGF